MGICRPKRAELEPKYQQYRGRDVLRGDIVNDDSGACAVFTGRGSSASQMSAAKVIGCHCKTTRLHNIRLHPSKIGGRSKIAQNSKFRVSRHLDTSSTTQMAQILVKHRRPSGCPRTKSVRTPTCRLRVDRLSIGTWKGKSTEL